MSKHIFWIPSYPKSGNTLMRAIVASLFFSQDGNFKFKKIANVTQFENRSRLNFIDKFNNKDFLNLDKEKTLSKYWLKMQEKEIMGFKEDFIFLKTHNAAISLDGNPFTKEDNIRGLIYLIRDPRDIVISWAKHSDSTIDESIKFITDDYGCISWSKSDSAILPNKIHPRVIVSNWEKNIISWTKNSWSMPKLIIKYEDLVYNKEYTILEIINFFKKNYSIEFTNIKQKLKNIIRTTDFKYLKKEEKKKGFNEATHGPFFRKGTKNQWQKILSENQIRIIENKFKKTMLEYGYKLISI